MWLERKMHSLKKSGQLFLSSERNIDVKVFSDPKFSKDIKKLTKVFIVSRSNLTTLENIPKMPKLNELNIDYTEIKNFANILAFPHLRKISFKGCPNLQLESAQLSLVIALQELTSINDKQIPQGIQKKAKEFPEIASKLVNAGWMAIYPCPKGKDLKEICDYYKVKYSDDEFESDSTEYDVDHEEDIEFDANDDDFNFEVCLHVLHEKHEEMIRKSQAMFGISNNFSEYDFNVKAEADPSYVVPTTPYF